MTHKPKQKHDPKTKPQGESKYALKIKRRKALAKALGMADAPYPVLLSKEEEE